jgi:superfamily II DNA helicase RecQ
LVVDWGRSFRKAYSLLNHFRNRLGSQPWFGCTATLDPDSLGELCRFAGFRKDVRIVRTSIDRPEIAYIRKVIPTNQKTQFRYLHFLIENAAAAGDVAEGDAGNTTEDAKPTPTRIPKSLLFFERKDIMRKCIKTLRCWLVTKCGYSWTQAVDTVVGYHATLAERDKTRIYAEFKSEQSKIRILCGTEAISTGLNVSDILQVIQVGMVRDGNINILLQRLGRGGRKGQKVLGIFFIEARWAGEGSGPTTARRRKASRRKSVRGISFAAEDSSEPSDSTDNEANVDDREINSDGESSKIRKSNLPDALYEFCNTETECLRRILLDHYQEPAHFRDGSDSSWCCSICNPELENQILSEMPESKRGRPKGGKRRSALTILIKG